VAITSSNGLLSIMSRRAFLLGLPCVVFDVFLDLENDGDARQELVAKQDPCVGILL
jgi:hypothetical protein